MTRLAKFAHRRGIARQLNATHGPRGSVQMQVQTVLPLRTLALYAARNGASPRRWEWRVAGRQRVGRWEWRWELR